MREAPAIYAALRLANGEWVRVDRDPTELYTHWRKTPMTSRPDLKALTGHQLRSVLEAAQLLRQRTREPFFRCVALLLADQEIGDGSVDRAIRRALKELHLERKVQL